MFLLHFSPCPCSPPRGLQLPRLPRPLLQVALLVVAVVVAPLLAGHLLGLAGPPVVVVVVVAAPPARLPVSERG